MEPTDLSAIAGINIALAGALALALIWALKPASVPYPWRMLDRFAVALLGVRAWSASTRDASFDWIAAGIWAFMAFAAWAMVVMVVVTSERERGRPRPE